MHTAELVISLRDFIRSVLDLEPVPAGLKIPRQGPARPGASRGGKGESTDSRGEKAGGGKNTSGGGMLGAGMGAGAGAGLGVGAAHEETDETRD